MSEMSWPQKKSRKFRYRSAEKVLRKEIPPVTTRRGRPVTSSGTDAVGRLVLIGELTRNRCSGRRKHRYARRMQQAYRRMFTSLLFADAQLSASHGNFSRVPREVEKFQNVSAQPKELRAAAVARTFKSQRGWSARFDQAAGS